MEATSNLRWVRRKKKVPPEFNVYTGITTEVVLQQWWQGGYQYPEGTKPGDVIQYEGNPPPIFPLSGEWRDIPIEDETTSPPHP